MSKKFCAFAFGLVLGSLSVAAGAADITVLREKTTFSYTNPECTIRLTGKIKAGDSLKLQNAFKTLSYSGNLCLQSEGGSYQEGLRIAEWLLEQSIGTVLEPNTFCYSACALIFMAGGGNEDGRYVVRYLHPTARLGFHAPYVSGLPEVKYDKQAVEGMYREGTKAIRDLARLGQKQHAPAFFLPKSLIATLLDKGPDEAFIVDNIFKVTQLHIRLYNYRKPERTIAAYGNACVNLFYGEGSDVSLEQPPEPWTRNDVRNVSKKGDMILYAGFGGEAEFNCIIRPPDEKSFRYDPDGFFFRYNDKLLSSRSNPREEDFRYGAAWYLYPPSMPIRDLR